MRKIFISSERLDEFQVHKNQGFTLSLKNRFLEKKINLGFSKWYDWLVNVGYYLIKLPTIIFIIF